MAGHFQVKLGGDWKDYSREEDKILKRAFMAGFPTAKFHLRGQNYIYDFKAMKQINKDTRKERDIRPPFKWKAPSKPLVAPGKTTVINVPPGAPGTTIQVPYPGRKGEFIAVNVPPSAKVGQAMLVPVPDGPSAPVAAPAGAPAADAPAAGGGGWSTGAKVAAGAAGVAVVGGLAVGGVVLGEHIAEHGIDATVDAAGDGLEAAGEAIGDFAVDAGEFVVDAAEDVGDFVMDLF